MVTSQKNLNKTLIRGFIFRLMQKIFNNEEVRTVWDSEAEKYYISVVDIVKILSKSPRPRKYWSDLKKKLLTKKDLVSCPQKSDN